MTTPRVLGLDLSLTATGLADFQGIEVRTTTIHSKPTDGEGIYGPHARLITILRTLHDEIAYQGAHPALIVVEGPSYGSKGAGTWDRGGLWWLVIDLLLNPLRGLQHPVAIVPPAVLKKYATGRGNADKTAMAVALAKRWDGVELRDDNKVDAFWLGAMGLDHLGVPKLNMPQAHREVLAKVTWPELQVPA